MGSGGVRGSQLLPARQVPSRRRLGVGSVLGPPQVHASPTLLHKHQGAESCSWLCAYTCWLQAPTDAREPMGYGCLPWGAYSQLLGLEVQVSHPNRNKSCFPDVTRKTAPSFCLLLILFLSLVLYFSWRRMLNSSSPSAPVSVLCLWLESAGFRVTWTCVWASPVAQL